MNRRRGRGCEEQVANACDSFVDLAPASEVPAEQVRQDWAAVLPGQPIPLIGEFRGRDQEDEHC
jgi:hypothetical protein